MWTVAIVLVQTDEKNFKNEQACTLSFYFHFIIALKTTSIHLNGGNVVCHRQVALSSGKWGIQL